MFGSRIYLSQKLFMRRNRQDSNRTWRDPKKSHFRCKTESVIKGIRIKTVGWSSTLPYWISFGYPLSCADDILCLPGRREYCILPETFPTFPGVEASHPVKWNSSSNLPSGTSANDLSTTSRYRKKRGIEEDERGARERGSEIGSQGAAKCIGRPKRHICDTDDRSLVHFFFPSVFSRARFASLSLRNSISRAQ